MSPPTLPQEIINQIVDDIGHPHEPNTRRALLASSCVSASFREPAQRRLFQSIVVSVTAPVSSRPHSLLDTLASNPQLSHFVESLNVIVKPHCSHPSWNAFPSFPRLRSLYITTGYGKWSSVASNARKVLYDLFQHPTLRELHLRNVSDFPIRALCFSHQLQHLRIQDSGLTTDFPSDFPTTEPEVPYMIGYLRSIAVEDCRDTRVVQTVLGDPSSFLSLCRLRKFSTKVQTDEDFEECRAFLELAGLHMDELKITFLNATGGELFLLGIPFPLLSEIYAGDHAVLPNLHNLRHIEFCVRNWDTLVHALQLIESIPPTNNLARLTIADASVFWGLQDYTYDKTWQQLDDVLMRERHAALH
ncbi:hypothetical protein DXG03_006674, partial [Asterophora parasitica]